MPRNPPTFLTLPAELRLEIYTYLLVLPPPPPRETLQVTYRCSYAASPLGSSLTKTNGKPTLYPQILRVNSQIYHEALPVLYSQNTFSAHPVASPRTRPSTTLTAPPAGPSPPSSGPTSSSSGGASSSASESDTALAAAPARLSACFSHADVLTLELWRGRPATRPASSTNTNSNTNTDATATAGVDVGVDTLRPFEHVRKKKITTLGNTGNACCRDACHTNGPAQTRPMPPPRL
ncbi:hypothetical protein B0I37DRAFT_388407 [Chaetomium sp. MPI-CAGE-AT-0009]|nr:hypothetical protein B0I37DRAFT_388407 [Chaetomium sp. MPI-CAGE-AT-0009]